MAAGIVIVGAGPAGITIAEAVRACELRVPITLISAEPYAPYAPPAMADYFMNGRDRSLYWKGKDICERLSVDFSSGTPVESLDTETRRLTLAGGEHIRYDKLVIATGSGLYAPVPGYDLEGVYNFKSLTAARRLVDKVEAGEVRYAVIVGAGFIGVELALLLEKLGVAVTLVEMQDRLMPRMLEPETADIVLNRVRESSILVRLDTPARAFLGDRRASGLLLESGETLTADAYIAATGVKPNIEWLAGSGVRTGWGVLVDDHLRTNVSDVYAAGDVAETCDRMSGDRYVHANLPNAVAQAQVVAHALLGNDVRYAGSESMNSLKHLGVEVIAVGAQNGTEELRSRKGDVLRRIFLEGDRIVGFRLAGDIRGAGVYRSLMLRRIDTGAFKHRLLDVRPGAPWFASLGESMSGAALH